MIVKEWWGSNEEFFKKINEKKFKKKKKFFFSLKKKKEKIYLGISLELLQSVWVRFSFSWLVIPAYTSPYLQAPSGVVGVSYRDFNLLHTSLLKRFPLFIWLLFAGLFRPNFRPDTGGHFFVCLFVLFCFCF